ncbi:EARLY RESPONSIVE TO DEHYDRATION 15 protein [Nymphaea thermarum]|nr:EARLY RESPONSIVE TO DEHYDRATION 15 protein [Nymphaea thermarum]
MAAAPGIIRSSLNPNAAPFIPSSFQQVEDFSPEWWELVKSSTWFRDYWVDQHQEIVDGVSNGGEEDDIVALLPETFELEEFPDLINEGVFFQPEQPKHLMSNQNGGLNHEKLRLDIAESLGLKSPGGGTWEQRSKYWEKPPQTVSPRTPNRRIIQQPR